MSNQPKYDLPPQSGNGTQALLLDAHASFSVVVPQGNGYMKTERVAQRKQFVNPLPTGTPSTVNTGFFLVREQNFRDIGGGFFEWDRLYANIPSTWQTTGQFALSYVQERFVVNVGGPDPGIELFATNKSAQVSARITHSYQIGYPDVAASLSLSDPVFLAGGFIGPGLPVRPPEVEVYMGNIYVIRNYTLLQGFVA